ncbi:interleukin-12 receptor subunit beta-1 isoform X1 [Erinaceus europaeus]|uniref:Interleukin-12 receptor subunit beta-1 isoform X1 n=1 Tax=Erinaceus europaeus TaxID=9365 RepID=A0ABM3WP15_ERIEU|nr:interleukin-12 receptor subunit beta-1 isoform X1 [Erinaceus europaeus]
MVGLGARWAPLLLLLFFHLLPRLTGSSCDSIGCCFQDLLPGETGPGPGAPRMSWAAVTGTPPTPDSAGPGGPSAPDCYRVLSVGYECSWEFQGAVAGVLHFLRVCMNESGHCCHFPAVNTTSRPFSDQDGVSVLRPVTVWVDTRGPGLALRSPPVTLTLNNWVKYDPPLGAVEVARHGERLLASWEPPDRQEDAEPQARVRVNGGSWELGDCERQQDTGPRGRRRELCLLPLAAAQAQELQIRRRRRGPRGPWSNWGHSVCVPQKNTTEPPVDVSLTPMGSGGRRRLTLLRQPPQLGELCPPPLDYRVALRMRSCCGPTQAAPWLLAPGQALHLLLSGAAYDLTVVRDPDTHNQSTSIVAVPPRGAGVQDSSVGANGVLGRWPGLEQGVTYCMEWRLWAQDGEPVSCTVTQAKNWEPADWANHSRVLAAVAPGQEACYGVSLLASKRPRKLTSWSTVFFTHHFGGNASAAGTPQLRTVGNISSDSAWVHWEPSPLSACPRVLAGYVLRYWGEDGGQVAEQLVAPTETHVPLYGLQAGTAYTVQVRADTAWRTGIWSQPQRFSTRERGIPRAQLPVSSIALVSLGSFLGVLLLGVLGSLGLSRAARHLCPPLPTPWASSAIDFPSSHSKQAWLWISPEDCPEEEAPPEEALVVDASWVLGPGGSG